MGPLRRQRFSESDIDATNTFATAGGIARIAAASALSVDTATLPGEFADLWKDAEGGG
jgi:hypothetical protein